ncbi:unnamed protein product [Protopolystoma xenopodis]|uniref:Uncharacterized protein n=1 Tax=Protopolystoma xenopodis TaxID=117903 RepID=A0A3S5B9R3_9PLAT|nr:unnamed protein product [Protopolystoma xenopodis]
MPEIEMMQLQPRSSSRLLNGRTRTATFTEDIVSDNWTFRGDRAYQGNEVRCRRRKR